VGCADLRDQFKRRSGIFLKPTDFRLTLLGVDTLPMGLTAVIRHSLFLKRRSEVG
jgi:hypothetical protein